LESFVKKREDSGLSLDSERKVLVSALLNQV